MNILNKFTIQNLKLNKKRTIVTIIGIMLSTALICGVAGLVTSFQKTLIESIKMMEGNYHTTFYNVPKDQLTYIQNNEKVKSYFLSSRVGWSYLEGSQNEDKPYLSILEYDKLALENYGIQLLDGRFPENSSELLISNHVKTNGRVNLKVGDEITLKVGTRQLLDGVVIKEENIYYNGIQDENGKILQEKLVNTVEKTYKIVGIIDRPSYNTEGFSCPGYTVITYMENISENANISVLYNNPKEYVENNELINEEDNCNEKKGKYEKTVNKELLRYEGALGDEMLRVLYGIAAVVIVIIVVSSIFVIRNSFSISVAEKNRQYGMMSSVGATSKQIRKSVLFEGFAIALIAIPLGILCGIIAIIILLQVVNYLLEDMLNGLVFVYSIPVMAIFVSIIISSITIYLSCLIPARRAAKISPIESIRGNNDIKKAKKVKTNKFIKKIFGIGGVIANKNLKRSRKKYRTTVISIVISIVIFISLSSFITCGNKVSSLYYTQLNFNIIVSNLTEQSYQKLAKLDYVSNYSYYYEGSGQIDTQKYGTEFAKSQTQKNQENSISIIAYNNEYFKEYIKELGIKEDYKTAVVLIDEVIEYNKDNTKSIKKIYNVGENDNITIKVNDEEQNIKISKNTDKRPMGLEATYYTSGMLIVSKDFIKDISKNYHLGNLFIYSENTTETENTINDLIKENDEYSNAEIINYDKMVANENKMVLVISIFLYGFITVITLIGVTNIFNTITTNMILRSKEFAMLKSVGMTTKEFNRMIRLESILYGIKSLLIGIPIGIIGSYFIYKSFAQSVDIGYSIPLKPIIISVIFVFIIVGLTMKYSLNKINKQNIIETIRKDNI